jgi:anhydro-N-acetylmuramic acid kinase
LEPIWAVGLMTGTVLDGNIDVAMIRTDGESVDVFGNHTLTPYSPDIRDLLERTIEVARAWNFNGPEPRIFQPAEEALTRAQAGAVQLLVDHSGMDMRDIGIVGFHGQTVLHRATRSDRLGRTRQLGDGALMQAILGTKVAYDFRSADVAAGGQGAPLAPSFHAALLRNLDVPGDIAILNLGGVGNITWWDGDTLIAFDTGPGNAPLNDFVRSRGLGEMDRDGALAGAGSVPETRLARLLEHPYLTAPYPKSLDRFDFTTAMADGLSAEDGAALLTAFTAATVGKALNLLPHRPRHIIVVGGGRRNSTMMEMLADRSNVRVLLAEDLGWSGDAIEAQCFGFLAVRALRGLPISFPTTTGVPYPMTGGRIADSS